VKQLAKVLGCAPGILIEAVDASSVYLTVRRLERIYGRGTVRLAYEQIRAGEDRGS
jgi:hypothetical protein